MFLTLVLDSGQGVPEGLTGPAGPQSPGAPGAAVSWARKQHNTCSKLCPRFPSLPRQKLTPPACGRESRCQGNQLKPPLGNMVAKGLSGLPGPQLPSPSSPFPKGLLCSTPLQCHPSPLPGWPGPLFPSHLPPGFSCAALQAGPPSWPGDLWGPGRGQQGTHLFWFLLSFGSLLPPLGLAL